MLRITKVLFYCSALVAVLGVLLSFFQPQIDVIDVIMETKIMSTLNHILPREESGIMEYGDGGGPVIGIDLGVSYSRVGVLRGDQFEIIPDSQGRVKTPSCVSFLGNMVLVGEEAKALATVNLNNTIHNIRNLVGRDFSDHQANQQSTDTSLELVEQNGLLAIQLQINGKPKVLAAHEALAILARKLKHDAELYLDEPIKYAIMTVPAYFNDLQREFVKKGALLAGLEVLRLINEPVAAGIANKIEENDYASEEGKIVFVDINDSTFDVTVSLLEERIYEILASTSVFIDTRNNVSSKDLDLALLDYMVSVYTEKHGRDITTDLGAMGRLRMELDVAESKVPTNSSTTITIQPRRDTPMFTTYISASRYRDSIDSVFQKLLPTLTKALKDANLQPSEIDALVITGEPSRVAKLKPFLINHFDGKPVLEIVPSDEGFVRGASRVAGVFTETYQDISCCLDVNPLALGVEVEGGLFHKLIPRNTVIPTRKRTNVTTIAEDQFKIVLRIFEGERPFTKDNKLVGTIEMEDIVVEPLGELPHFELSFDLDANSILKVILRELSTGREETFLDTTHSQVDYNEVDRMVSEAEEKFEEDEVAKVTWKESIEVGHLNSFSIKII